MRRSGGRYRLTRVRPPSPPPNVSTWRWSWGGRQGLCHDGIVIDLAAMDEVHVDHRLKTARVGAGATWGQVDAETQAFGLAVTGGVDSRTGVAGLTLGGGIGYLARAFGLTIDNLASAPASGV